MDWVIGGLLAGIISGLVPLIFGMKKDLPNMALGGFFACIITGLVGGFVLAIPMAAGFWYFINKASTNKP